MNTVNKLTLIVSILFLCMTMVHAEDVIHEFGGSIWLTTNYMFRGITNTDNNPAIQGEVDYSYYPVGFNAYIWASNIDFDDGDSTIEIEYGAGFSGETNNGIGWDIGAIYYSYPGSDREPDIDYFEVYGGPSYTFSHIPLTPTVSATAWYSPDFFGEDGDAVYIEGNIDLSLPYHFTLNGHIGYQDVDGDQTSGPSGFNYMDYAIGLSKEVLGFGFDLNYTNTSDQADACGNTSACDGKVVFTVSRSF